MSFYNLYQQDLGAPPPPPPPPSFSQGTPPPPPPPQQSFGGSSQGSASTNSIMALVFGILSFVLCPFILGITAWIMGKIECGKIQRGESSQAGLTMAKIGMWLGVANVVLCVLCFIGYVFIALIAIISSSSR